ncbi:hypothetical protein [Microbacterium sp. NPDC087589]|uniref:hypothetical protein n=1 Tax=Microbacterium sp. NPDC087589 TaxID=3364191 RepID=UPI0038160F6D
MTSQRPWRAFRGDSGLPTNKARHTPPCSNIFSGGPDTNQIRKLKIMMGDDAARDALYMAKIRANLANQNSESVKAQTANAPKRWSEAQEAELVQKLHGDAEARIQKLIEDANNGNL